MKNNCCMFQLLFKIPVQKNGIFLFWNIIFSFRDIETLRYCSLESFQKNRHCNYCNCLLSKNQVPVGITHFDVTMFFFTCSACRDTITLTIWWYLILVFIFSNPKSYDEHVHLCYIEFLSQVNSQDYQGT